MVLTGPWSERFQRLLLGGPGQHLLLEIFLQSSHLLLLQLAAVVSLAADPGSGLRSRGFTPAGCHPMSSSQPDPWWEGEECRQQPPAQPSLPVQLHLQHLKNEL